ncbi:hypothetical protein sos41_33320 [Alphaproteobacteria bacterium SO-S41]|nr:hypothetical protein sos41_33320 [Alphaproteobacteria bacterium SO-S41]
MKSFLNALALPVVLLGCALILSPTAAAQETLAERKLCDEASEDPKSMLACLKALNTRISAIEDEPDSVDAPDDTDEKITKLEDELRQARAEIDNLKVQVEAAGGGGGGAAASGTITAPFTVVDASGAIIFAVTGTAGDVKVTAGGDDNGVVLTASAANTGVLAVNGERSIQTNVSTNLTAMTIKDPGQGDVGLGHIGNGFSGVLYRSKDGGDIFKLGGENGKGAALRMFDAGKPTITATSEGGDSKIVVGTDDKRVALSVNADNSAVSAVNGDNAVNTFAGSGLTAVTVTDQSKAKLGLGFIGNGFSGLVYKQSDESEVFNLGLQEGKGAALRLFASGKTVAAIGSNMAESGAGAVFIGNGSSNGVAISSDSAANGSINIFKGGPGAAIELRGIDTVIALFENGTPLASLIKSPKSNGGNLVLNAPTGDGVVDAGAASGGGGNVCVTRHNGKLTCLGVGLPGMGGG